MNSAAASVSAGALPSGAVAAANRLSHASAFTRVAQPASTFDSVAKLAKGRRLRAVQPVRNGGAVAAGREIDEVVHVAGRNAQARARDP